MDSSEKKIIEVGIAEWTESVKIFNQYMNKMDVLWAALVNFNISSEQRVLREKLKRDREEKIKEILY